MVSPSPAIKATRLTSATLEVVRLLVQIVERAAVLRKIAVLASEWKSHFDVHGQFLALPRVGPRHGDLINDWESVPIVDQYSRFDR